jgi:hypothetical protein
MPANPRKTKTNDANPPPETGAAAYYAWTSQGIHSGR